MISDWNTIMQDTVGGQNPFAQARFAAITQLAVFDAVNAITGDYHPYLGSIAAPKEASPEAAAVAAAHGVLLAYFPASADSLNAARADSLATIPDGRAKSDGIAVGAAVAAAMVALRASDGAAPPMPYAPMTGPGLWQPTPPAFGPGILLHWGRLQTFGILNGAQFRSLPPPALTSNRYRKDYDEVKAVGDAASRDRPQDRSDVARFFAIVSAVRAWNPVALQLSAAGRESISELARSLALINMAISDGLVSSMESKYFYHLWRPVTAIRAADTDGNPRTEPNTAFTPFIDTPAFPSYPSAHASASYAARTVLERTYGRGRHAITLSHPAVPGVTLRYSHLRQITDDIDDARVYGGIHFRFDQEEGELQGMQIGWYITWRHLQPCSRQ